MSSILYDFNTIPSTTSIGAVPTGMVADGHANVQATGWLPSLPNALEVIGDGGATHWAYVDSTDPGGGNGTFVGNMKVTTDDLTRLMYRMTVGTGIANRTGYEVQVQTGSGNGVQLLKEIAGTETSLGTVTATLVTGNPHRVTVRVSGSTHRIEVFDVTTSLYLTPTGTTSATQQDCLVVTDSSVTGAGRFGYFWYSGGSNPIALSTLSATSPVPSASLSPTTVLVGGSATATATGFTGGSVTWTSSNTAVATIGSSTGTITPVATGTCTFIATGVSDNTQTATTPSLTVISPGPRYVSSAGSDSAAGTLAAPWLTAAHAVASGVPGDTIAFRGGDTFTVQVTLNATTGARTLTSYGTGRAKLANSGAPAVAITDVAGVVVNNLTVSLPTATSDTSTQYPCVLVTTTGTTRLAGFTLTNSELIGGIYGVNLTSGSTGGIDGAVITGNSVHDCPAIAIYTNDSAGSTTQKHFSNMTISHNEVFNISGAIGVGAGIVPGNCDTAAGPCKVESNHVYNVGYAGGNTAAGPGGMFPIYSDGVQARYNVVHDIYSNVYPSDGSPFDFDMGVTNCLFEFNLGYDCQGAGLLCLSAVGGNVFRWNTLVNCASRLDTNVGVVRMIGAGSCTIHNNTIVAMNGAPALYADTTGNTAGKKFYNNLFCTANGTPALKMPTLDATFNLEGNAYSSGVAGFLATVNGTTYTTLAAFRTAFTTLETGTRGFSVTGLPFVAPYPTLALTDPGSLAMLGGRYGLAAGSPLLGAGLDLQSLFSVSPGTKDITGATLGNPYAVGAIDGARAAGSGSPTLATTYTLGLGSDAPVAGERYRVTARIPAGTVLASDVTVTLAGTNLQYSATQGGSLSPTGTLTIAAATGTGTAYYAPTAAGTVSPTSTNAGGLADPATASLTATVPPDSPGVTTLLARIPSSITVTAGRISASVDAIGGIAITPGIYTLRSASSSTAIHFSASDTYANATTGVVNRYIEILGGTGVGRGFIPITSISGSSGSKDGTSSADLSGLDTTTTYQWGEPVPANPPVTLAAAGLDAVMIEPGYSAKGALKVALGVLGGAVTGNGTTSITVGPPPTPTTGAATAITATMGGTGRTDRTSTGIVLSGT